MSYIEPTFGVYSRTGAQTYNITDPNQIDNITSRLVQGGLIRNRVLYVVHGFQNNFQTPWLKEMADALLSVEDSTVIIVGWGKGADLGLTEVTQAIANILPVSELVANLTASLKKGNDYYMKSNFDLCMLKLTIS